MKNLNRSRCKSAITLWIACLVLCMPSLSPAWGPGGHMIVAQIAQGRLNPRARAQVKALLALPINPADVSTKSQDFVSAAHWADDLRSIPAFKPFEPLHFIDNWISADGTPLPPLPTPHIVQALRDNVKILKTSTDQNARAQALRLIIHFVGDIHQPLHCAARVDRAHPMGDQGGNLTSVKVRHPDGTIQSTNLHSYWDGGLGTFPKGGPPPQYQPPPLSQIPAAAATAKKSNPDTDPALKLNDPTNFKLWANESFALAKSAAYAGIGDGTEVNAAYRNRGVRVVRQRVAWGGYRLAALLNSIWP